MASAKCLHYTTQLRAALVAGQWHSNSPIKSFGTLQHISWQEGLRKWKKHATPDSDDLAASATELIAVGQLIESTQDTIDTRWATSTDHTLSLQGECTASATSLQESLSSDGTKALLAYASGNPSRCLTLLDTAQVDGDDLWTITQKIRNMTLCGIIFLNPVLFSSH